MPTTLVATHVYCPPVVLVAMVMVYVGSCAPEIVIPFNNQENCGGGLPSATQESVALLLSDTDTLEGA